MHSLITPDGLTFSFVGPPIEKGPLPSLFYFALSAKDSLESDPFNQPATLLLNKPIRIFSACLPGHEEPLPPENGLKVWAKEMSEGTDPLSPFFLKVKQGINYLLKEKLIDQEKLAIAGLSRGAFVACHIAALCPQITSILGFAPLTKLTFAKDFSEEKTNPLPKRLDLENLCDQLYNRHLRFYMGNCDTRVGTENAFSFIHKLALCAKKNKIRSSPIELFITPSIGYQGHGTSPLIFSDGIEWLQKSLGI